MPELHTTGPWYVNNGSMFNKYTSSFLDEDIAILVDISEDGIGTLLKVGKFDQVNTYYTTMIQKYLEKGFTDIANDLKLIKFNVKFEAIPEYNIPEFAPDGYNLTVHQICTILNWFVNCSCQNMKEFFESPIEVIETKISQLQSFGY